MNLEVHVNSVILNLLLPLGNVDCDIQATTNYPLQVLSDTQLRVTTNLLITMNISVSLAFSSQAGIRTDRHMDS